ncbi:MAG: VapE family protein [bacterium]|nr:VapE family protein [bacterium]
MKIKKQDLPKTKIAQSAILKHVAEIASNPMDTNNLNGDEATAENKNFTNKNFGERQNENEPLITKIERFISSNYELRFDEVRNVLEVKSTTANDEFKKDEKFEANLTVNLLRQGFKGVKNNVSALLSSNYIKSYHPVREYFNNLYAWDGKDRISELCACIEVMPKEYQNTFQIQLKKHLLRCIASAFVPGFFNKQCFVIVGKGQSMGKTSFIRYLVPEKLKSYSTDAVLEWKDKDANIALCSNWMINMDELANLNKDDTNSLKATLSRNVIKLRRPYDKIDSEIPRLANFFGSTNDVQFLTDLTGNVRWVCFRISKIDWKYSSIDIDQLWSQILDCYKKGESFQMSKEELVENDQRNHAFMVSNPEMEAIQSYLIPGEKDIVNKTLNQKPEFKTATELMKLINEKGFYFKQSRNFGKALQALEFTSVVERYASKPHPVYGYWYHEMQNEIEPEFING